MFFILFFWFCFSITSKNSSLGPLFPRSLLPPSSPNNENKSARRRKPHPNLKIKIPKLIKGAPQAVPGSSLSLVSGSPFLPPTLAYFKISRKFSLEVCSPPSPKSKIKKSFDSLLLACPPSFQSKQNLSRSLRKFLLKLKFLPVHLFSLSSPFLLARPPPSFYHVHSVYWSPKKFSSAPQNLLGSPSRLPRCPRLLHACSSPLSKPSWQTLFYGFIFT